MALPGIAMVYGATTRFVNHTLIDVSSSRLAVRHAPLPWPGGRSFATRDVRGLHAEIRRVHARSVTIDESWILVVRANARKKMLLKGLEMSALETSFIMAAIAEYLEVPVTAGRR